MKKLYVLIAVLLVALVSMSYIIGASQEERDSANSNQIVIERNIKALAGPTLTPEPLPTPTPTPIYTPTPTPLDVNLPITKARYLFVQTAQSGSFVPVEGKEKVFTLSLNGVSPQTIAFADRPERVVEQVPMQKFLDGLGFSAENPPNAAIEILEGNKEEDLIVVELFEPVYDAANRTLQYQVSILETPNHSQAIFNRRHDETLPKKFGPAALFIDDCKNCYARCNTNEGSHGCYGECEVFEIGQCWNWKKVKCMPCRSKSHYEDMCAGSGTDCDNCLTFDGCGGW